MNAPHNFDHRSTCTQICPLSVAYSLLRDRTTWAQSSKSHINAVLAVIVSIAAWIRSATRPWFLRQVSHHRARQPVTTRWRNNKSFIEPALRASSAAPYDFSRSRRCSTVYGSRRSRVVSFGSTPCTFADRAGPFVCRHGICIGCGVQCTPQPIVGLAAEFRIHPFRIPLSDEDLLDGRERIAVGGQEREVFGRSGRGLVASCRVAPRVIRGLSLCTTGHCSYFKGSTVTSTLVAVKRKPGDFLRRPPVAHSAWRARQR
jgi:hypothetical protein